MSRSCIESRIDCALEKMRAQGVEVRAIYLTKEDQAALGKEIRRRIGGKGLAVPLGYAGHIIQIGNRSTIYSKQGVEFKVPMRLSHRVAA